MLEKLTNWLKEAIEKIFDAFMQFMGDLFWIWVKHILTMWLWVFNHIPPPPFLDGESLGAILGRAGPVVGWIIQTFRIGESFTVIGVAMVFFVVRRFFTLGIW